MSASSDQSAIESILPKNTVRIIATTVLVIVVFIVINVLRQLWQSLRMRWTAENQFKDFELPKLTARHWLFGHVAMVDPAKAIYNFAEEASKAVRGVMQLWLGPFRCYLALMSPDAIKTILGTAEPKDAYSYNFIKPWIGDGLLLSGGKKWQRNRKLLTPAFHFEILKPYTRLFSDSALTLVKKWKLLCQGKEVSREMFQDISLFTLDSLLKCIFSVESNCQTEGFSHPYIRSVYELSHLAFDRLTNIFYHIDVIYNLTPSGWRWRRAIKSAHTFTRGVIAERKNALKKAGAPDEEKSKRKYVDFVDILLGARDEHGNGLTDREIEDEVDTFMFEGHDTTASGISWMLYNMARHPEFQQKCRDEVDELLQEMEEDRIEWDDLSKLPYLTMCLKESLRIHSPVPAINRQIQGPLTFPDGRVAPPGTNMTIFLNAMHLDNRVWKDAENFIPERFTPGNSRERSPYTYVPFSAGPRNCIGQHFAMNEMKVVVALILRHFYLRVDDSVSVKKYFQIVLRSKNGIHLFLKPRDL